MPTCDLDNIDSAAADRFEVVDHLLLVSWVDYFIIRTLEVGDRDIIMACAGHFFAE